jgi:hypothetical protein
MTLVFKNKFSSFKFTNKKEMNLHTQPWLRW